MDWLGGLRDLSEGRSAFRVRIRNWVPNSACFRETLPKRCYAIVTGEFE